MIDKVQFLAKFKKGSVGKVQNHLKFYVINWTTTCSPLTGRFYEALIGSSYIACVCRQYNARSDWLIVTAL